MPVINDPDHVANDPDHPFHKTAILFAPKRLTSSNQNSSQKESNPSDSAPSEEPLTGMDDPRWMKDAQDRIDADLQEHWRRTGKLPPEQDR